MNLITAQIQFHGTNTAALVFPSNLQPCVSKVLGGEYAFPLLPDMPGIRRVIDVGANVGAFAAWAYMQWPGCWLDGYEPNPLAAQLAQRNSPPGCIVHNVAVTTAETAKLHIGGDWGWSSTVEGLNAYTEESIDVPVMHPRDLPPCDLLKLDCEGCEAEIIGAYSHWPTVHMCMFEWHIESERIGLETMLRAHGLRCFKIRFDRATLGQEVWIRSSCRWDEREGRYVL